MNPLYLHADGYQPEESPLKIDIEDSMPVDEIHVLDSNGNLVQVLKLNLDTMEFLD